MDRKFENIFSISLTTSHLIALGGRIGSDEEEDSERSVHDGGGRPMMSGRVTEDLGGDD